VTTAASERGQVAVLSVLFLTTLVGMSAFVLDVGSWFREDRRLQSTADAAALAGAQLLPGDPAGAIDEALTYADLNGGDVAPADVRVDSSVSTNDTLTVTASTNAPGFFSKLFGIFVVPVGAAAAARAANVSKARWVAPIAVNEGHPLLRCLPEPCFEQTTTVGLANLDDPESSNASGSFGLLRLSKDRGSISTATIASWLRDGYDGLLGTGSYPAATGAKYNSSDIKAALAERIGDEVLFPVYRTITGSGANAAFEVIGWVGFVPEAFTGSGSTGTLTGRFTRVTWEGTETDDPNAPDFGVRTVLLVR
jgi:Putative Flp pilus-assembly TadE/G-like